MYDEVTEADCSGYVILAYNGVQSSGKTAGFSRDNGVSTFKAENSKLKKEAARSSETMAPSTNTSSTPPQDTHCFQLYAANSSSLWHTPVNVYQEIPSQRHNENMEIYSG